VKAYEAGAEIEAPPEAVWDVLTDAPGWAAWDAGATVEGRIARGERIKITSQANPGRAYPVKVAELDKPRRMVLTGGMPLGLFKGVRTYTLEPRGAGRTAFKMREEFSGPMLPLIWRSMPDLGPSFAQFANGLKARAESRRQDDASLRA
jgi:uncharacterized protein YndB with AHSA1/START domain